MDSIMFEHNDKIFPCSTSLTMSFIGGKWKAVILMYLVSKKRRYSELHQGMKTISERTLSLHLKEMESDGLVKRTVFTKKPPLKVEYELTEFGRTLIPVLNAIYDWGKEVGETNSQVKKVSV